MPHSRITMLVVALASLAVACVTEPVADGATPRDPRWVQVFADGEYRVAVDTAHATRNVDGSWLVWFETRHASTQEQDGRVFNRERIHSLVRCDELAFKTVHVAMSLENGPVVYERGGSVEAAARVPWRTVRPNTVDLPSMSRACALIRRNG